MEKKQRFEERVRGEINRSPYKAELLARGAGREEILFSRKQALSRLRQNLSALRSSVEEGERSSFEIAAQAQAQSSGLSAARAQVGQQAAGALGDRAYAIRAPIAGTVTALQIGVGLHAKAQTPMMVIIPSGAELQAELEVPSSAIGFVRKNQRVSIAVDAFPYQRFGTLKGDVMTVPESAVARTGGTGDIKLTYPVRVKLDQDAISAFGRREPLVSGMSISARIVTEKQSLIEWLFEPLFAVRQR
jgi:membrane fusion protein